MGLIRLILALIVAGAHANYFIALPAGMKAPPVLLGFMPGTVAVLLFFMISGFLISTVLRDKYPVTWAGTRDFYANRAIRIYSLYLPLLALALMFLPSAWAQFTALSPVDRVLNVTLLGADWGMLFGAPPTGVIFVLSPAWSLAPEMTFYLLAPLLLRSPTLVVAVFVASVTVRAVMVSNLGFDLAWTYRFMATTFLFFLVGHFAAAAGIRWVALRDGRIGLACLLASWLIGVAVFPVKWDSPAFWLLVALFAASLPGIFNATKNIVWMNALGALSYPIYLTHMFVVHAALSIGLAAKVPSAAGIVLIVVPLSFLTGILAHNLLEKPIARLFRAKNTNAQPVPNAAPERA